MAWNTSIDHVQPGTFGVSHGSGLAGELIRHATESWAGHAFVYIGDGRIIEAAPPAARINQAHAYDDIRWAFKQPLTANQRRDIVWRAHALVGTKYDDLAYIGFGLEVLKLRSGTQLDAVFKQDNWRVCSALVDDCYQYAKVALDWVALKLQVGQSPNLVSPGMLLDLAALKGWL